MPVSVVNIDPNLFVNTPKTSENFELARFRGTLADGSAHTFSDTELRTVHSMLQRWGSNGLDSKLALDNFNRFYSIFPDMEMPNDLKTYIFITRPEMNLLGTGGARVSGQRSISLAKENQYDTRLQYLAAMSPEIMYMLTEDYSADHEFIPYLQSRAESMQIPDYEIRTSDFTVPFFSYKFAYPTVTNESITGGTFDITFREDSDLRITKLFQFWIYYMDAVMKNKMKPTKSHITDNAYDFMCSVYEIITDPGSERILFWTKYTGCFPVAVPISNLSHNKGSTMDNKVNIQFQYMMIEALEPRVITDFNNNSSRGSTFASRYNYDFGVVGDSLVGAPHIIIPENDQHNLYLVWSPRKKGVSSGISSSIPTLTNIDNSLNAGDRSTVANHREYSSPYGSPEVSHNTLSSYIRSNSDSIR